MNDLDALLEHVRVAWESAARGGGVGFNSVMTVRPFADDATCVVCIARDNTEARRSAAQQLVGAPQ